MLFITPPAVTDLSEGNMILEKFLKGMKSDQQQHQQQQQQSVPESEDTATSCAT